MKHVFVSIVVITLFSICSVSHGDEPPTETALDRYVKKPDDSYTWKVVSTGKANGINVAVVDMVSQTWRTKDEVDRPQWQHWITFAFPDKVTSSTGFLFIGGGKNGGQPPAGPDEMVAKIAAATGTVVAELKMIPNQPLVFHDDGEPRVEDDLIGYTWDQYIKTGDATWPARNPMVKSAVRALDTITAFMASADGGQQTVDKFVVAGGSKRGWTTWMTGAVDSRVVGIVPIVIDVVNARESMQHHFAAYGFWAPAVGNYVQHRIMERMDDPRLQEIYELVDPYFYRHRLTMPKLILNAAGDQFFLPDSSQFYWGDLQGPKYLRYVPNADHGMDGSDALESVIAFYSLILADKQGPKYSWSVENGKLTAQTETPLVEVRLWQANNPLARDFRVETLGRKYTSTVLQPSDKGVYTAELAEPKQGWTASFIELTYDVGAAVPLKLTTAVQIVPDVLPFADKYPSKPATATIVCEAETEVAAAAMLRGVQQLVKAGVFRGNQLTVKHMGATCYINWSPPADQFEKEVGGLTKWLKDQDGRRVRYQLESGPGATIAPGHKREPATSP